MSGNGYVLMLLVFRCEEGASGGVGRGIRSRALVSKLPRGPKVVPFWGYLI